MMLAVPRSPIAACDERPLDLRASIKATMSWATAEGCHCGPLHPKESTLSRSRVVRDDDP